MPGSDRALVADSSTGTVTQLDHVSGVPTPSLLSGGDLSKPVGLDMSADGRWALMANSLRHHYAVGPERTDPAVFD